MAAPARRVAAAAIPGNARASRISGLRGQRLPVRAPSPVALPAALVIAQAPSRAVGTAPDAEDAAMRRWLAAVAAVVGASLGLDAAAQGTGGVTAPAPAVPGATARPPATRPPAQTPGTQAPAAQPGAGQPGAAQPGRPGVAAPAPAAPASDIVGEGPMYDGMRAYRARDYPTALRLWREEAGKGNVQAMVNVGEMYAYALGVPEDFAEAVRWFRRASDTGDAVGQFSLAFMYENGRGVPQNVTEARRLYTLSANQGYSGAIEALRDMREPVQVPRPATPGTPRRTQ